MPAHQAILSLNGGELTPYLAYLNELDKHGSGCARMENFLPMPYGGFRARPGLRNLATLDAATRLQPFVFSEAYSYILAFTATDLKIFGTDGTLKTTIAATFTAPFHLEFWGINSILIITEPTAAPRRLTRTNDTTWVLDDLPFDYPPLLDQNLDEGWLLTVTSDAVTSVWSSSAVSYSLGDWVTSAGKTWTCISAHTSSVAKAPGSGIDAPPLWIHAILDPTDTFELTSSEALFTADHVGATFELAQNRDGNDYKSEIALNNTYSGKVSPPIEVQGRWSLLTFGSWTGVLLVQRSKDNGLTWETFLDFTSATDANYDEEYDSDKERLHLRLYWTDTGTTTGSPHAELRAVDQTLAGLVTITAYNSATSVEATTLTNTDIGPTDLWTEGAFSDHQGYPTAVTVHERRLTFAGTARRPLSLWLSRTDDLLDFQRGTIDDDSIYVTLGAKQQDPIQWLASQRRLYVGTRVGEWVFGAESNEAPLSPTNLLAREYTKSGSSRIPALNIDDAVVFVSRNGRRIRELGYTIERETYSAADLTRLAEHITEGRVIQMAWQQQREPSLWAVTGDGRLLNLLYSRPERLAAWSQHTTIGGACTSIASVPGAADDMVYLVTLRGSTYSLEMLEADQQAAQEADDYTAIAHLDAATYQAGYTADASLPVPAHLEGQLLTVLADGVTYTATVASATITIPVDADHLWAGLLVAGRLVLLPQDTIAQGGATHSRLKRAEEIRLAVYKSWDCCVIYDGVTYNIDFLSTSTPTDAAPALHTGWLATTFSPAHLQDLTLEICRASPYPFTARALVLSWAIHETPRSRS